MSIRVPAELQLLHAPCMSMHTTAGLLHASSPSSCTSLHGITENDGKDKR